MIAPGIMSVVDVEVTPMADDEADAPPAPTTDPLRTTAPAAEGPAGVALPPPHAVSVIMPRTRARLERLRTFDDLRLDVMRDLRRASVLPNPIDSGASKVRP
jgi:hypothetical protein